MCADSLLSFHLISLIKITDFDYNSIKIYFKGTV